MLEALNDDSQKIDDVLDTYFDTENLVYWMAFQILTGNCDTQNRNCYLYSPLNSNTGTSLIGTTMACCASWSFS